MALCNPTPDFNMEEMSSVSKNQSDLTTAVQDMADHLPKEDPGKGFVCFVFVFKYYLDVSSHAGSDLP